MTLKCPRCHHSLTNGGLEKYNSDLSISAIKIDECTTCGGIWFDEGELEEIHEITHATLIEIRKIPSKKEQFASLNCPKCNDMMEKIQNKRDIKVIMDVCQNCKGIWLDKGELQAIQEENLFLALFNTVRWIFENS